MLNTGFAGILWKYVSRDISVDGFGLSSLFDSHVVAGSSQFLDDLNWANVSTFTPGDWMQPLPVGDLGGIGQADAMDLGALSGTASFADGATRTTISIEIMGDASVEEFETFTLNLSNSSPNLNLAMPQAIGAIANDDADAGDNLLTGAATDDVLAGLLGHAYRTDMPTPEIITRANALFAKLAWLSLP